MMISRFLLILVSVVSAATAITGQSQVELLNFYSKNEAQIRGKAVSAFPHYVFFSYSSSKVDSMSEAYEYTADAMFFVQDQIEKYLRSSDEVPIDSNNKSDSKYVERIHKELVDPTEGVVFEDLPIQILFQGFIGDSYFYDVGVLRENLDKYSLNAEIPSFSQKIKDLKHSVDQSVDKELVFYRIGAIDQAIASHNRVDRLTNFVIKEVVLTPHYYNQVAESMVASGATDANFPSHPERFLKRAKKYLQRNHFSGYLNSSLMAEPNDDKFSMLKESLDDITYEPLLEFLRALSLARQEVSQNHECKYLDAVLRTGGFVNFSRNDDEVNLQLIGRAKSLLESKAPIADIRRVLLDVIEGSVNHSTAWNLLGVTYRAERKDWSAIACFRQSLRIDPGNAFPMTNLALSYDRNGLNALVKPMALAAVLHSDPGSWAYNNAMSLLR